MAVEYPEGTWLSPHPSRRNGDSSTDPSGGADESPTPTGESGTAYDLADNLTARLWLRRGDRLFVGVLAGLGLLMLTLYWLRISGWGRTSIDIENLPQAEYQYEIDINRASWVEWSQLQGIGEKLAQRIVEEREIRPFESIDDLLRVRGLGRRRLDELRPFLRVELAQAPQPTKPPSRPEPSDDDPEETLPDSPAVP
jgi:competence protein ComEA